MTSSSSAVPAPDTGEDVRAAVRRVARACREHGVLVGAGLAVWCGSLAGRPDRYQLAADLTTVGVAFESPPAVRPPAARGGPTSAGYEIRVREGRALTVLERRMPTTLASSVPRLPRVDSEFDLAVWRLDRHGDRLPAGAVKGLAADWPRWTGEQAAVLGLVCALCAADLRPQAGDDLRRAFADPLARPGALRLLCEGCLYDRWESAQPPRVEAPVGLEEAERAI